ncbi:hypothetical protein BW23_950 [Burkholderia ubonensis MSMB22]|nr:hypothetical protein BW23_950 [Burkholderia ubonensis MSMB22]
MNESISQRKRSKWLYLGSQEMLVVIPNLGHETDKKYLVYHYVALVMHVPTST